MPSRMNQSSALVGLVCTGPQHRPNVSGDGNTECWAAMVSSWAASERRGEMVETLGEEPRYKRECVYMYSCAGTDMMIQKYGTCVKCMHFTSIYGYESR